MFISVIIIILHSFPKIFQVLWQCFLENAFLKLNSDLFYTNNYFNSLSNKQIISLLFFV